MGTTAARKVYESPTLIEIGTIEEKTEFFSFISFEKLFAIKKHYLNKHYNQHRPPSFPETPDFS